MPNSLCDQSIINDMKVHQETRTSSDHFLILLALNVELTHKTTVDKKEIISNIAYLLLEN